MASSARCPGKGFTTSGNTTAFVLADVACVGNEEINDVLPTTDGGYGNFTKVADSPTSNPFILPWHIQMIYIFAFVTIVLVSAGGNIIVIWVVVAHKRMRTVINYFLVNLAVADALISVLNALFNFVYMLHNNWPFGKAYCRFSQFISPCTISASVFTFMAIAIDR